MVVDSNRGQHLQSAFAEEQEKLVDVIRHIAERRIELIGRMPATAADQRTADAIQEVLQNNADSFYAALDQPYFGRLDYFRGAINGSADEIEVDEAVSRPNTIYLGIAHIPGQKVFSWTAPVGALWYTQSYKNGYTAPAGYIPTRVDLKRYLRIREMQLEDVNDIFSRQLPAEAPVGHDALTAAVSGVGTDDGHLQVIVGTIEPEQYENIANVSDRVLIVQGAAGSGKSEIGLHRIAFLLSPFNQIPERERPTPETTLFVGPSETFLEFASDILPSLGIQEGVERVKFSDWLMEKLSARTRVRTRIWSSLLAPGSGLKFDVAAESFKGTLDMADVIDRHTDKLRRKTRRRCRELGPISIAGIERCLELDDILRIVDETLPRSGNTGPLNRERERFVVLISGLLWYQRDSVSAIGAQDSETVRSLVRSEVERWCSEAWPSIDFRGEYVSLVSNVQGMIALSNGAIDEETAQALAKSVETTLSDGFDDSDLGALAYMDHVLNGTVERRYRHVVVDEAQDISPIEFKLLSQSSTNNWFTVLGDTAQRLTPYRGIKSWREIERVFGRSDIARQRARTSYRSTRQITEFNNRILRTFDPNIPPPKPYSRDGHRVEFSRHSTGEDMYAGVIENVDEVRSLEGMRNATVAILSRDQRNMNRFMEACGRLGVDDFGFFSQVGGMARSVAARIPDVKGLEFDAVIVIGVNDSFDDSLFNKKLVYLATTRAKHYLAIHWAGRQSPILRSISDRGVVWRRR